MANANLWRIIVPSIKNMDRLTIKKDTATMNGLQYLF